MNAPRAPLQFVASDLAPGDTRSLTLDPSRLELARVTGCDHPLFAETHGRLLREFGPTCVETRAVLEQRFHWDPAHPVNATALLYEMIAVREGGRVVALRDHTAIVALDEPNAEAVVHLSHVLVEPEWRRTGLAGWLRALPLETARECVRRAGLPTEFSITLVAEMEHPRGDAPERLIRLRAYEQAGFRKLDPARVPYVQPDFRASAEIDATGGPRPLPFALLARRVGRESDTHVTGAEVIRLVEMLYRMYGASFRAQDMAAVWKTLEHFPGDDVLIPLLAPTAL